MVVYQPWPRLRINFDNDGAVFVLYPWGAGGKFVINSLAVSTRAVLQDASLAEQQLNKELSTAQFYSERLVTYLIAQNSLYPQYLQTTGFSDNVYPDKGQQYRNGWVI
jgi:hypothetical protein